jgi:hypothetical protein
MKKPVQLLIIFVVLIFLGGCAGSLTEGTKVGARENKDGGSYKVQKEVLRF